MRKILLSTLLLSIIINPIVAESNKLRIINPAIGNTPEFINKDNYENNKSVDYKIPKSLWRKEISPSKVIASSHLKEDKVYSYDENNLIDDDLKTSWVEGKEGYGIGEYIEFYFQGAIEHSALSTLIIYNGIVQDLNYWKLNSRVKELKLYVNDRPIAILKLADTRGKQSFLIGEHRAEKGKELIIELEILSVYKGENMMILQFQMFPLIIQIHYCIMNYLEY